MKRKIDLPVISRFQADNSDGESRDSNCNYWTSLPFTSRYYEILNKRKQLPVYEFKDELQKKVRLAIIYLPCHLKI